MILQRRDSFSINYKDETVENVFISNSKDKNLHVQFNDDVFQSSGNDNWAEELLSLEINDCLLISAPTLNNEAIESIKNLSKKAITIFILLSEDKENQAVIESLCSWCSIRTGEKQSGMLIIADPEIELKSWGKVYSSTFSESSNAYSMALDEDQIDDYYRLFCKLYWEDSKFEYLGTSVKIKCKQSVIGSVDITHSHILPESLEFQISSAMMLPSSLSMNITGSDLSAIYGTVPISKEKLKELSFRFSLNQVTSNILGSLVSDARLIELFPQEFLPQILLTGNDSFMLPMDVNRSGINWVLKLSKDQVNSVNDYSSELESYEKWELNKSTRVEDLNTPIRFANDINNIVIRKSQSKINLNRLECNKFSEYESESSEALAKKYNLFGFDVSNLANEINYKLDIYPPLLPENSKLDGLNNEWSKVQSKWDDKVSTLKTKLNKIKTESDTLSDSIKSFMGNFLTGQIQASKKNRIEIERLDKIILSDLDKFERKDAINSLSDLTTKLGATAQKLNDQIDISEQTNRLKQELNTLEDSLSKAKALHDREGRDLTDYLSSKQAKLSGLDGKLLSSWKDWVEGHLDSDKQSDCLSFNVADIVAWNKENSTGIKNFVASDKSGKDAKVAIKKSVADLTRMMSNYSISTKAEGSQESRLSRAVEVSSDSVNGFKIDIDNNKQKTVNIQPTGQNKIFSKIFGGDKSMAKVIDIIIPGEDLPKVGELYKNKNRRLLAISNEIDIDQAKDCAARLESELVVKREVYA